MAEELAARLVALSARAGDGVGAAGRRELGNLPPRSTGVSAFELRGLVASGSAPVIASLPLRPLTPCEVQHIWMTLLAPTAQSVPLLVSRPTALVRSDLDAALVGTWDGLLRITAAGGRR